MRPRQDGICLELVYREPLSGAKLPKGTGEGRCRLGPRAEKQRSLQGSRGCGEGCESEVSRLSWECDF